MRPFTYQFSGSCQYQEIPVYCLQFLLLQRQVHIQNMTLQRRHLITLSSSKIHSYLKVAHLPHLHQNHRWLQEKLSIAEF